MATAPIYARPTLRQSLIDDELPPSNALLLQNLPNETTKEMLNALFGRFEGYTSARLIESKPGIAFVDFDAELNATRAMESLQGFKVTPTHALHISYAKK